MAAHAVANGHVSSRRRSPRAHSPELRVPLPTFQPSRHLSWTCRPLLGRGLRRLLQGVRRLLGRRLAGGHRRRRLEDRVLTSWFSSAKRGWATGATLASRSLTLASCTAGSTNLICSKLGSMPFNAGTSFSWSATACWPTVEVVIQVTKVSAAALFFALVETARPKSASPNISLVLPACATSGNWIGTMGNGFAPETPAALRAAVIAFSVDYCVYQVPIMTIEYLPVRKSLLASGYCW